jgi:hypothetical protein
MNTERIDTVEDYDFVDPIGDLRRALNTELPTQSQFHKWYNQLKNLPEFFEIAKKRTEQ